MTNAQCDPPAATEVTSARPGSGRPIDSPPPPAAAAPAPPPAHCRSLGSRRWTTPWRVSTQVPCAPQPRASTSSPDSPANTCPAAARTGEPIGTRRAIVRRRKASTRQSHSTRATKL